MEKLIKIQSELKAPKGNYNSFGKFRYRAVKIYSKQSNPYLQERNVCLQ